MTDTHETYKQRLQREARELGLPDEGTVAELKERAEVERLRLQDQATVGPSQPEPPLELPVDLPPPPSRLVLPTSRPDNRVHDPKGGSHPRRSRG